MFLHALFVDVKVRWGKKCKKVHKQKQTSLVFIIVYHGILVQGKTCGNSFFFFFIYLFSPSVFLDVEVRGRKDKPTNKHVLVLFSSGVAAQGKGVVIFFFLSFSYIIIIFFLVGELVL